MCRNTQITNRTHMAEENMSVIDMGCEDSKLYTVLAFCSVTSANVAQRQNATKKTNTDCICARDAFKNFLDALIILTNQNSQIIILTNQNSQIIILTNQNI